MYDKGLWIICLVIFVTVFLGIEGLYLWWYGTRGPEVRRMERRLRALSGGGHAQDQLALMKRRVLAKSPLLSRLLLRMPRVSLIDKWLVQAGLTTSVAELLAQCTILALLGFLTGLWCRLPLLLVVALMVVLALIPCVLVARRRAQRLKAFDSRLAEAIDLLARALRAGHALPTALQMAGDEMPEPMGGEFRMLFDEINFGVPLNDALLNLVERIPSTDLKYFVVAVTIQRETGGNLAELLDNISAIIRERLKLLGKIRTLTAEGKLSAWILAVLPFAVAALIFLANRGFLAVLWTDPVGLKLVMGAAVMMVIGIVWMRAIIRIRI